MIEAVLFDLNGVLYTSTDSDADPVPGALQAIDRITASGMPVRYITNTTRSPSASILEKLEKMGFAISKDEIFTAPLAVKKYLIEKNLSPFLLIHPDLEIEFADLKKGSFNAVVVGDAGPTFSYENMNTAFRLLDQGCPLIAMGMNRYFREKDGLSLDAGPFIVALEYAASTEAVIIGKPSAEFFRTALMSINCKAENAIMIGDDVEADVIGALDAGLQGILVKTGKYKPGDEEKIKGRAECVEDISEAVDWILEQ